VTAAVQAVVFDLDGTLLDHEGAVERALGAWLPLLGVAPTGDLLAAWLRAEERHFPAWRAGRISFAEQRRRRLRDFLPLVGLEPGGDDDLDRVFAGYLACYEAAWTKFDDVDPVLALLRARGIPTAVLTNGSEVQQHAKLRAVGLLATVGAVLTAEALGTAKPDPVAYLLACRHLGVDPGAVLHVGDLHDLDVLAARAAGLQAVHLDRAGRGPADEPCRITSLGQLRHHLPGG
jgi:putative hydrolase of the HAD superfamily